MTKKEKENILFYPLLAVISIIYLSLFFIGPLWERGLVLGLLLGLVSLVSVVVFFISSFDPGKKRVVIILSLLFLFLFVFLDKAHNDIYRFLWDGNIQTEALNPYEQSPWQVFDSPDLAHLAQVEYWELLDFKSFIPIYGPSAELLFLFSALLYPNSLIFYKLLMFCFGLVSVFLFTKLIDCYRLDNKYLALVLLSPVFLFEASAGAHLEVVMVFFLLLSIYFFKNKNNYLLGASLAWLVLSKFYPLLLLPFFIKKSNILKTGFVFLTSSFLLVYKYYSELAWSNWLVAYEYFNANWLASPGFAMLGQFGFEYYSLLRFTLLLVLLIYLYIRKFEPAEASFYIIAAILFTSPVVFAWYFMPLLFLFPFVKANLKWAIISPAIIFPLQYILIRVEPEVNNTFIYLNNGLVTWHQALLWLPSIFLCFLLLYQYMRKRKLSDQSLRD